MASWSRFTSYAACCENNPNYDPDANTAECRFSNVCDRPGWFAYAPDQKSYDWVKSNDVVAFYSRYGDNAAYGNKRLRMKARNVTLEAEVLHTCDDDQECNQLSQPSGYLLVMESETLLRRFGTTWTDYQGICWQLVDSD